MKNHQSIVIFLAAAALIVLACNKENTFRSTTATNGNADNNQVLPAGAAAISICDQFAYRDTIFYKKQLATGDYIVKPLTPLTGTFGALPVGLKINPLNGNINVSKSESGLEYKVWFVAQGTTDTCIKYITISGIDYTDSIYVLANNATTAKPVYDANPPLSVDCSSGCEFDDGPDDDNGNGTADEPPAGQEVIPQGIAINKVTGAINLKQSIQNGALGKNPLPGTYKDFILNYRVGDKSAKALNKISFRLYYYATQAQIPAKLKDELANKQSQVLVEGEEENESGGHHGGGKGSNATLRAAAPATTTSKKGVGEVKCRPPYIIVTQQ